jgi:hypothetical protein
MHSATGIWPDAADGDRVWPRLRAKANAGAEDGNSPELEFGFCFRADFVFGFTLIGKILLEWTCPSFPLFSL